MRAAVALLCSLVGGALFLGTAQATGTEGADPAVPALGDHELARGATLYQRNCAACHGQRGGGREGSGITAGPSVDTVDVALVDLMLRTGRMPIPHLPSGVRQDQLTDDDRRAVVGWMQQRFGLPGQIPTIGVGDPGRGLDVYVRHCVACHGATGAGGIAGGDTPVPELHGVDGIVLAEAVRTGPLAMPAFSEGVLDDEALADVFAYLGEVDQAPRTPAGLREINPVASALATIALITALVALLRGVARTTRDDTGESGSQDPTTRTEDSR